MLNEQSLLMLSSSPKSFDDAVNYVWFSISSASSKTKTSLLPVMSKSKRRGVSNSVEVYQVNRDVQAMDTMLYFSLPLLMSLGTRLTEDTSSL